MFCHGIQLFMISDRGVQNISRFWRSFQEGLGIMVKLSTVFLPQTMVKRRALFKPFEDILRDCIIDFKGNDNKHLPLVEFY